MRSVSMTAVVMLLASLCFMLAGCAAFPQHQVADVTDMPSVVQYQNKPLSTWMCACSPWVIGQRLWTSLRRKARASGPVFYGSDKAA